MNKLREQIAQQFYNFQNKEGLSWLHLRPTFKENYLKQADAIIALLQPRMLTKDERIAELEAKIKDLRAINEQHRILNGQLRESLQGEIDAR